MVSRCQVVRLHHRSALQRRLFQIVANDPERTIKTCGGLRRGVGKLKKNVVTENGKARLETHLVYVTLSNIHPQ